MRKSTKPFIAVLTCLGVLGCGGSQSPPEAPAKAQPAVQPTAEPPNPGPARPELTAEACKASGGEVIGDIGDGAIHRPDYRCPSGAAPSGNIRAPEGGPIAVEGSVCCPSAGDAAPPGAASTSPARMAFTQCEEKRPTMCTKEYRPVCAEIDNGIRCVKAPCPSTNKRNFGNACEACAETKTVGYWPAACEAIGNDTAR
jgi:hypothetical protein